MSVAVPHVSAAERSSMVSAKDAEIRLMIVPAKKKTSKFDLQAIIVDKHGFCLA